MGASASHHTLRKRILKVFPPPRLLSMSAVGMDITDSSIRFLEFITTRHGKRLGKFGTHTIPEGIVVEGKIRNKQLLVQELAKLKEEYKFNFIRATLPEEQAYLFQTTLPLTEGDESEVRGAMEFKIEENVPILAREAVFDYEVIGYDSNGIDVNAIVFPKEMVSNYIEVFRGAGLTPLSFEVEAQAIARAVIPQNDPGTYMVVDFGKSRTGIAIVSDNILCFTSTVAVGGSALTAAIRKHFKVDQEEADKIKNEKGFARYKDNEELFASLMNTVSALKDEVNKHYLYWNTRMSDQHKNKKKLGKIEKIILCGGSANLAGLSEYLSFSIKAPVELANVWVNVFSFDKTIPSIERRYSFAYAPAVGLALRDLE